MPDSDSIADEYEFLLIWADGQEERLAPVRWNWRDGMLVIETEEGETRHIPFVQLMEWRTYGDRPDGAITEEETTDG